MGVHLTPPWTFDGQSLNASIPCSKIRDSARFIEFSFSCCEMFPHHLTFDIKTEYKIKGYSFTK